MTLTDLRRLLAECPLVASVQGSPQSPVEDPATLLRLARASLKEGVRILRLEGPDNIRTIREGTGAPTMGLFKRWYEGSEVYVTPTMAEVEALLATGCEMVALDCTDRPRPNGADLVRLIAAIKSAGRLVMADCDSVETVRHAMALGADFVSTTLAGYTEARTTTAGPDLAMVREAVGETDAPILAEGRFQYPWQVKAALRIGAAGVVIGGALNDPIKQTRWFVQGLVAKPGRYGAIDLGGTWLRVGVFDESWTLLHAERVPTPPTRHARMDWIRAKAREFGVQSLGVATGGVVWNGMVVESKSWIPEHLGTVFQEEFTGLPTFALNDGLATAWGHANRPEYAGRRIATLSIGTGVGFGMVNEHRPIMGAFGAQPRLNDLRTSVGRTFEELLGGLQLTEHPSDEQKRLARLAFVEAVRTVAMTHFPERIVLCGGVGLGDWLDPRVEIERHTIQSAAPVDRSPFGHDAGLYGAAALALYPPPLPA